jgi:GNAT superfamily N-acetyltransferase
VIVRMAEKSDVAGIGVVSLAAGQEEIGSGAEPAYVELLLATGTVLVAHQAGGPVLGWGAIKPFRQGTILSDLFVDPAHHGRGMGTALLARLWPGTPSDELRVTFSSQHPSALPVYLRAGLAAYWPLLYLSGNPEGLAPGRGYAERAPVQAAADAERHLIGDDRSRDYAYWSQHGATGLLVRLGEQIIATGAASPTEVAHLACADPTMAQDALSAVLRTLGGPSCALCVPGPHPAVRSLLAAGFAITDYDIYMSNRPDALSPWSIYSAGLG